MSTWIWSIWKAFTLRPQRSRFVPQPIDFSTCCRISTLSFWTVASHPRLSFQFIYVLCSMILLQDVFPKSNLISQINYVLIIILLKNKKEKIIIKIRGLITKIKIIPKSSETKLNKSQISGVYKNIIYDLMYSIHTHQAFHPFCCVCYVVFYLYYWNFKWLKVFKDHQIELLKALWWNSLNDGVCGLW